MNLKYLLFSKQGDAVYMATSQNRFIVYCFVNCAMSGSVLQGTEAPGRPASQWTQVPNSWVHWSTEGEIRLLQLLLKVTSCLLRPPLRVYRLSETQSCGVGGGYINSPLLPKYDAAVHSRRKAKSRSVEWEEDVMSYDVFIRAMNSEWFSSAKNNFHNSWGCIIMSNWTFVGEILAYYLHSQSIKWHMRK